MISAVKNSDNPRRHLAAASERSSLIGRYFTFSPGHTRPISAFFSVKNSDTSDGGWTPEPAKP
jgi:hypothetical protein